MLERALQRFGWPGIKSPAPARAAGRSRGREPQAEYDAGLLWSALLLLTLGLVMVLTGARHFRH